MTPARRHRKLSRSLRLPLHRAALVAALAAACSGRAAGPLVETAAPAGEAAETRAAALESVRALVAHLREADGVPGLAVALVERGDVLWTAGFGEADPRSGRAADADTLWRVGSLSKLVTSLVLESLAREGALDLDVPVAAVLPDFWVEGAGGPVLVRHLLTHRAGLVREPPVGGFLDPSEPDLDATVRSLRGTRLLFPPGSREVYSNAAPSVAGRVAEVAGARTFEELAAERVLDPAGMESSVWHRARVPPGRAARGHLRPLDGRAVEPPTFDLGTSPATGLWSSARDLGRLAAALLADGRGPGRALLPAEALAAMLEPAAPGASFGLGFALGELDGRRTAGHDGAVHGFSSTLLLLPDEGLGAVVLASLDGAGGTTERIARHALRALLGARSGAPPPEPRTTTPVDPREARLLAGTWRRSTGELLRIDVHEGEPWLIWSSGGARLRLRSRGRSLLVDDPLRQGDRLVRNGDVVGVGGVIYRRYEDPPPPACPEELAGLVGEYGPEWAPVLVLEEGGGLQALVEWFFAYPLEPTGPDTFRFPDWGLYAGEDLRLERDADGRGARLHALGAVLERRPLGEEPFRVEPALPPETLRARAAAARPPREPPRRRSDLVDLRTIDGLAFDVRYATADNVLGFPLYERPAAFAQRPAAEGLARARTRLAADGLGLVVHDALRPWRVTKMLWDATPPELRAFVADPARGSRHNRGCAVDVSLLELATGAPCELPSGYDEFSPRASPAYPGGTSLQRWHARRLRRAMEEEGFSVYPNEWWHFDHADWRAYPLIEDLPSAGGEPGGL